MCPCLASHEPCYCGICLRQPPSLRLSALRTVRTLVFDVERFELNALTTYDEYVFAVMSDTCRVRLIIPPEYPQIRIWYRHDLYADSPAKYHKDCPGVGPWRSYSKSEFETHTEAIEALLCHRNHFWCAYCNRALFFPNNCDEEDHA